MEYVVRAVFSGLTLYMLLILLRWLGGAFGFETDYGAGRVPFLDVSVPLQAVCSYSSR